MVGDDDDGGATPTHQRELARLTEAISDIYDAATTVSAWPGALESIADCFDARGCVLVGERDQSILFSIVSPGLEAAGKEYDESAWKEDFLAQRVLIHGIVDAQTVYTEREMATPEEVETHPFFTGFRKRHRLGSFMATCLEPQPNIRVILSMQGTAGHAPFDDEQCETFGHLARHVERALMLSSRILDAEAEAAALSQALAKLGCGIFVLDNEGRVTSNNAAARSLLGEEIRIENGRLEILGEVATSDDHLPEARTTGSDGFVFEPDPPQLVRRNGELFCAVYSVPLVTREHHPAEHALQNAQRLLIVLRADESKQVDSALVRDVLGITLGEARLAGLIASGQSLNEAANALDITVDSARTILKRVFAKTGVSRQTDLALLVSRLVMRAT